MGRYYRISRGLGCCAECRSGAGGGIGCGPTGCTCRGRCNGGSRRSAKGQSKGPDGLDGANAVRRILIRYAKEKIRKGEPFYITKDFNSDRFGDDGLGFAFLPFLLAAGQAASAVSAVATVGSLLKGPGGSNAAPQDPAAVAAQLTPAVLAELQAKGVNIPSAIAPQVVQASLFGDNPAMKYAVFGGLGLLALLVVMK